MEKILSSLSMQNILRQTRRRFVGLLSDDNRHALRLLFDIVKVRTQYIVGAVVLGIASAFFEGNTMGILAIAVTILIEGSDPSLLASLGPIGDAITNLQATLSLELVFVSLLSLAALSQILRSTMDFGNQTFAAFLSVHIETNLQERLFHQYTNISYSEFMKYKLGDMSSLLNYTSHVGTFVRAFNGVVVAFVTILFYMTVLLWLSPMLLVVALVLLVPLGAMMRRSMKGIRQSFSEAFSIRTQLNERITEYLQAGYIIRTYSRDQYAKDQAETILDEGERTLRRGYIWHSMNTPLFEALSILVVVVFLLVVIFLLPRDIASLPLTLAFLTILWRLSRQTSKLNAMMAQMNRNWVQVKRMSDVLRRDDKSYLVSGDQSIASIEREITFDDVQLAYQPDEAPALDGVNLTIPAGKTIALVGESGSGKSSLINLLLRMFDPTAGTIRVDDTPLTQLHINQWRDLIGFVSQDTFVFNDTISENIRFGRLDATDDDIIAAAKAANAHDFIMSFKDGYQTIIGERGTRLSGGQRQRLALARALVRNAKLLILDEATSALDSESERIIQDTIFDLYGTRTIVVIAHRLSTIKTADVIYVLESGQVVEQGTHDALLAQDEIYSHLWSLQSTGNTYKKKVN